MATPAQTIHWLQDLCPGPLWLDGGWGVDALIGRQTRPHDDVDIVLAAADAAVLEARLRAAGLADVPRDDTRPCNFVLGAPERGLVDFHVVRFDAAGDGLYGDPTVEGVFPSEAFTGEGVVAERSVRCMSPAFQVANHASGYPLRPKDHADMRALAKALCVPLPPPFR